MKVPLDVGRIPHKIELGMANLTADQWKNWTCIYSLYVLHGILPSEHLEQWNNFVQACIIICQPVIADEQIHLADGKLLEFCRKFENVYGAEACTINLHLHCHLAECLLDYGPVHSTWCFSFERYNGVLGKTPNNNRSMDIERTMVIRFIQQLESKEYFGQLQMICVNFFRAQD